MTDERKSWMIRTMLATVAALTLTANGHASPISQNELDSIAHTMGLRYEVVDNHPEKCPTGADGCFLTHIMLTMPKQLPSDLAAQDFSIYFSFVNRLPVVESDVFQNELINGDLNRLTLKPGARLVPGQSYKIKLWGIGAHHSQAFPMPNFYITARRVDARVIEATRPIIDPDTGLEKLPFVVPMTDAANLQNRGPDDKTVWQTSEAAFESYRSRGSASTPDIAILPTPKEARLLPGSALDIGKGVTPALQGLSEDDIAASIATLQGAGVPVGSGAPLKIRVDSKSGLPHEGYQMSVGKDAIDILAADAAGANYALYSLTQQALFEKGKLRPFFVKDAPRYGFRGLHIDLARNFHSKAQLLKLIDAMALYKLNKLHLHLADDEGWRIEIKSLPELGEVGGKRCHDPAEQRCLLPQLGAGPEGTTGVNGALSQADYIDIVRAAKARQIEVIPSIDMPGHSRAAIRSMEVRYNRLMAAGRQADAEHYRLVEPGDTTEYRSIQNYNDNTLNVCIEPTYRFFDTVVDEVAAMHRMAGAPLKIFHIGADETAGAWSKSPACKPLMASTGRDPKGLGAYFIERVSNGLAKKGLKVGGWSDGMGHTNAANMPKSVQTNIWGTLFTTGIAEAHVQANQGWDVVLSIPDIGYLDMPYVAHPEEGGYDWASRSVDTTQIFGFMTDNLAANGAAVKDTFARPQTIEDKHPRQSGRSFAGLQAQLWSETTRTDAGVDYQLFPRLIAFAERAWHKPAWEPSYQPGVAYAFGDKRIDKAAITRNWNGFAGRMPTQFSLLDQMGVAYRISPPGARIVNGQLEANSEYPEQAIEYRSDNGAWQPYSGPIAAVGKIELRARSMDGKRASRIVSVP